MPAVDVDVDRPTYWPTEGIWSSCGEPRHPLVAGRLVQVAERQSLEVQRVCNQPGCRLQGYVVATRAPRSH